MPAGQNNFLQWDPSGANMESDALYAADVARAGGAGVGSLFPSATANKAFYQWSTFIAAFAQALANKGFNMTDTNLANLAGVLANVVTQPDLISYAKLASPLFSGIPQAPNPALTDNSQQIATTHFVQGRGTLFAGTGYTILPNGLILEWITGPFQSADGSEPTINLGWPLAFPSACLFATVGTDIANASTAVDDWYQLVNFSNTSINIQRQHGDGGSYQQQTRPMVFAIGF